jgi:ferritin-like metal-binding protein YciE
MADKTLHDMLLAELQDLHSAERQLTRGLPKMAKAATNPELKKGFESHLEQTREHVQRLDEVFAALGSKAKLRGKKCEAMEGLLEEADEILDEGLEPAALDSALICAAQKVEHYEIASYGTVVAWVKAMGHQEALAPLEATLKEEKETDILLTKAAEKINKEAAKIAHPKAA